MAYMKEVLSRATTGGRLEQCKNHVWKVFAGGVGCAVTAHHK